MGKEENECSCSSGGSCETGACEQSSSASVSETAAVAPGSSSLEQGVEVHPIQYLQDMYLQAVERFGKLEAEIKAVEELAQDLDCRLSLNASNLDIDDLSTSAVRRVVRLFQSQLTQDADLDSEEEFQHAFGASFYDLAVKPRKEPDRRWNDRDDDEPEWVQPPPVLLDLRKLWDSMQARYADGGEALARQQAAKALIDAWDLDRTPFKIEKGKATINQRVYSEKRDYGNRQRHVSFHGERQVRATFDALRVFFVFADLEGDPMTPLQIMRCGSDINVYTGEKYVLDRYMSLRTFNEAWRWVLDAPLAEKLQEFIGTYGSGND